MLLSCKGKTRTPGYRLTVIRTGLLSGFIPINRSQGGYTAEHYMNAYEQAEVQEHTHAPTEIVNLPGCQVVRTQECSKVSQPTLQITAHQLTFNRFCMNALPDNEYVELLLHPAERLLAVRPCEKENINAVEWNTEKNRKKRKVEVCASAFAGVLYQLMSWESNWYLKIHAVPLSNGAERVVMFDLRETEYQISDMPRSDSPDLQSMETTVVKMIDMEREIDAEIDKLVDLKREIRDVIQKIHTPRYRALLEMRYLSFMTWEEIAESLECEPRSIYRAHYRALCAVEFVCREIGIALECGQEKASSGS